MIPDPDLARIARGHRVRAVSVDGNDVHAVYAAATDAVAGARRGDGPSFLQMHTYLTRFHIQFDRPSREVRPADEMAAWLARDPIELLWRRMLAGGAEPGLRAELERAAAATVDAAVAWAQASPYPPAGALTADLALGGGG